MVPDPLTDEPRNFNSVTSVVEFASKTQLVPIAVDAFPTPAASVAALKFEDTGSEIPTTVGTARVVTTRKEPVTVTWLPILV